MENKPIAKGWETILARAPSVEDREKADAHWRALFYSGAIWLWSYYCRLDDDEVEEFVDALETEIMAETKRLYQLYGDGRKPNGKRPNRPR